MCVLYFFLSISIHFSCLQEAIFFSFFSRAREKSHMEFLHFFLVFISAVNENTSHLTRRMNEKNRLKHFISVMVGFVNDLETTTKKSALYTLDADDDAFVIARRLPVIPLMSRIFNRRNEISHSTHRTAATEKIDEIMSNLNNYYTRYDEMNICLTMAICSRLLAICLVVVFFVCTFDPPNAELLCLKMAESRV